MNSATSRPLTDEEINALHRDGAVLIKDVLSAHWIELLAQGLEFANDHPDGMSAGVSLPLRIDQFPAANSPKLAELLSASPIAGIVGSALNAPVRFYMDQMFYKPAGPIAESAWHQDTCYYNVEGEQLIRAWVCADPAPRNVSLEVVRGSHLWNVTYRPPVGRDPKLDPEGAAALEASFANGEPLFGPESHQKWTYFDSFLDPDLPPLPRINAARDSFDIIGWDYQPGDIILFHGNILHSALGGVTLPHPRRSHASLWAGPDVRYLHRRSQAIPDPIALYNHQPADGQSLADFPDVFPVAWAPA
jgi:ectoine hydroxylase-related dioxygenase (phytanoyl-CoA dioxygenase family)